MCIYGVAMLMALLIFGPFSQYIFRINQQQYDYIVKCRRSKARRELEFGGKQRSHARHEHNIIYTLTNGLWGDSILSFVIPLVFALTTAKRGRSIAPSIGSIIHHPCTIKHRPIHTSLIVIERAYCHSLLLRSEEATVVIFCEGIRNDP